MMKEKAHGSERTTEARQGVGDEFGTRVQGTGLGCEFSRARRVNVGLRAARSECACLCVSAEGGRGGENERVERVWYGCETRKARDCMRAGSAQKRCRKGKSRVHVCGRLRTPDAGRIYAQLKGCALDHNEKDRGCSVSLYGEAKERVTSFFVCPPKFVF